MIQAAKEDVEAQIQQAVSEAEVRISLAFQAKLLASTGDLKEELQKEKARCNELQLKLEKAQAENNRLEQYSRRSHIRIQGLKLSKNEDTKQAVADFLSQKLTNKHGSPIVITRNDLDAAHPLPIRADATSTPSTSTANALSYTKTPPVIVRFHERELRDRVIRARRSLKQTGFTIQEDLTAANARLLKQLTLNKKAFSSAWTWGGKVYAIPIGQSKAKRFDIWETIPAAPITPTPTAPALIAPTDASPTRTPPSTESPPNETTDEEHSG